jgi:Leucine-rich repeat (LRR) protein
MPDMETLSLGYNRQVSDIAPLKSMTKLKWLNLAGNEIRDFTPLRNLISLREIWVLNNPDILDRTSPKIKEIQGYIPNCVIKIYDSD